MSADILPDEALGRTHGRGRLQDRRVLVIGAGQKDYRLDHEPPIGNGRAISVLCAREGAALALSDIDEDSVRQTARLVAAEGARAHVTVADSSDESGVERVVRESAAALGGLDGLVLVVGTGRPGDLRSTSVEDWDWTFATNVRSHFLAVKHALPLLSPGAAIVFVSSIAAYTPIHEIVAYHSSKAALEGLKNVVARKAAAGGIRANIVVPGFIDTAAGRWGSSISPERRAAVETRKGTIPLRRQGTAWEIAYPTVFLLSPESSYITGQTLVVDGGHLSLRA
ncbi:SDR family NAD(P)-dependent oxidoreductase [Spongiactinospora sp. 9N601]|uniref:SDR family NAD(P)-dependent oxidoreductase n=1 Tax=Spongiactinospora sp. 9N601 TaxID=3375149 RepID=UPI0037BC8779